MGAWLYIARRPRLWPLLVDAYAYATWLRMRNAAIFWWYGV